MTTKTDQLLANYRALCDRITAHSSGVEQRHPTAFACQKGCDSCCRHLSLFPVEAAAIRQAIKEASLDCRQQIATSLQKTGDRCPLLVNHICLLYAVRPLICRTHGLPILIEENGEQQVDHCPLNFQQGGTLAGSDLLSLDTLNQTLAAINQLYMEQSGEEDLRLSLAEILRQGLAEAALLERWEARPSPDETP